MATSDAPLRPVILVTGANAGVGFGTCQRLLVQLSEPRPSDTLPSHPSLRTAADAPSPSSPFTAPNGVTLLLACRNAIKAHRARVELQHLLDDLAALPDDSPPLMGVPPPSSAKMREGGGVDEDADPALVAQEEEASVRRRRTKRAGLKEPEVEVERQIETEGEREREREQGDEQEQLLKRSGSSGREDAAKRAAYRRRFCKGTRIEFVPLDLGSMASALECAKEVRERHPYVTHVILNAGLAVWTGINWPLAVWMILTNLPRAVTWPKYKNQRAGDVGADGYGWVWQCNLGAHYILTRALLPAMRASPYPTPSRVIWTGSIEAFQHYYTPSDFQCLDPAVSPNPYESTKYQCELAALGMDEQLRQGRLSDEPWNSTPGGGKAASGKMQTQTRTQTQTQNQTEVRSFLVHPGVVSSSIFVEFLNVVSIALMRFAFYLARWLGSPHHPIEAYKGGVAASHVALAPFDELDTHKRYGARCDFWGHEYVGASWIDGWQSPSAGLVQPQSQSQAQSQSQSQSEPDKGEERALDGKGEAELQGVAPRDGSKVMRLANDLVEKCEAIATRVWKEANEGSLPPWSALNDGQGAVGPAGAAGASRDGAGRGVGVGGAEAGEQPDADALEMDSDDWEKVDRSV